MKVSRSAILAALLAGAIPAAPAPAPLAITGAAISQSDGGEPLPASFRILPGDILFLGFQVAGYRAAGERIRLRYKIAAQDPKGVPVMEPYSRLLEAELAPQDKEWKPRVRHEITVPPLAPSGRYRILMEVTDEVARSSASAELAFQVEGRPVDPSESLVLKNFRFYRSENATEPLAKAAYRPGDAVWARFDITGFRYGAGNKIDVSYGVTVFNAAGRRLFGQEEAAFERSESFYPKPYVPGSLSLSLQPDIRPGEYAILVTARDAIGNQTCEEKHTFTVE